MASIAGSLAQALPKPKYTGEEEEIPIHAQQRGPRILGAGALDETQVVLKVRYVLLAQSLTRTARTDTNIASWTASVW